MNFKEFYLEWERKDFVLTQLPNGGFEVNPSGSQPQTAGKTWQIQLNNGQLQLPRELEGQREAITTAYFKHRLPASAWGKGSPEERRQYPSDIIEPEVFSKGSPYQPEKESMSKILRKIQSQG